MDVLLQNTANNIPAVIRKKIIEERIIDIAFAAAGPGSAMEYLFDVHAEFLDPGKEYQDFECPKCKVHVLSVWHKLKEYL